MTSSSTVRRHREGRQRTNDSQYTRLHLVLAFKFLSMSSPTVPSVPPLPGPPGSGSSRKKRESLTFAFIGAAGEEDYYALVPFPETHKASLARNVYWVILLQVEPRLQCMQPTRLSKNTLICTLNTLYCGHPSLTKMGNESGPT